MELREPMVRSNGLKKRRKCDSDHIRERGGDSGIGTPISDDGKPMTAAKRAFIPQPPSLAEGVEMKDYQVVGLNWLNLLFRNNVSGILADDMGLGKTLQTIAFIAHLSEIGETGPHLIVVPSATLENWLRAFKAGKLERIGSSQRPLTETEAELARVKRELALVRMERDILKKAAAYFAKESLHGTR